MIGVRECVHDVKKNLIQAKGKFNVSAASGFSAVVQIV